MLYPASIRLFDSVCLSVRLLDCLSVCLSVSKITHKVVDKV